MDGWMINNGGNSLHYRHCKKLHHKCMSQDSFFYFRFSTYCFWGLNATGCEQQVRQRRRDPHPTLNWKERNREKVETEREGWVHNRTAHHITPHHREKLEAVALTPQWPHPTDPANLVNFMEI